jgi:hypothetical protein
MRRPEILGIEVGRTTCRGVRIDPGSNEIVAAGEVPFGPYGLDRDGVIEPSVVATALDTLVVRLGVDDRSQVDVGLSIGPRNAGVGSGPAMGGWLQAQAATLGQPLVCSGGLGLAFVPIRAVDQAVKTAFDIGLELARVDLAPVAAARAVGDQVDDLICVGSGRGWQARMRDFEVLEALENQQVGPEEPISFHASDGATYTLARYGWVEVAVDLLRSQQFDVGRLATATGAAIGVLYGGSANLLEGKVINGHRSAPQRAEPERAAVRAERTLQLGVIEAAAGPMAAPSDEALVIERSTPVDEPRRAVLAGATSPARSAAVSHSGSAVSHSGSAVSHSDWGEDRIAEDDPINLFSPDTEVANILGRPRFPLGLVVALVVLAVVAIGLGLAYLFG